MNVIATVSASCPLCGRSSETTHARGLDFEYGTTGEREWEFKSCEACEVLVLSPRPATSELRRIYPEDYYAYDFTRKRTIGYVAKELLDRLAARTYLSYAGAEGRILDVGCGDGRLLRIFKDLGAAPERLYGIELDDRAVNRAREQGLQVERVRFEEAEYPEGFFRLAVLQQVIEHVTDPRAMIEKLARVLVSGGAAIFETPNTASWDHWLFPRRYWGGYHIPRHFFLFNKRSLPRLLRACGFQVRQVRSLASPMFWIHSFHHVTVEKGFPRFVRWLFDQYPPRGVALALFTVLDTIGKAFGITSNMRVVAVKP